MAHGHLLTGILGAVFGVGTAEILIVDRINVPDENGEARVVIGTDEAGNGMFVVYDSEGNEIFGIDKGRVSFVNGSPNQNYEIRHERDRQNVGEIISVFTEPPSQEDWDRVDLLFKQADVAAQNARQYRAKVAGLQDARSRNQDGLNNKIAHTRAQAAEWERKERLLRGKANKLKRELSENRQIITVWDGKKRVSLKTTKDLSAVIGQAGGAGGFIGWTGTLITANDAIEYYEVSSIRTAQATDDFVQYKDKP